MTDSTQHATDCILLE